MSIHTVKLTRAEAERRLIDKLLRKEREKLESLFSSRSDRWIEDALEDTDHNFAIVESHEATDIE